MVTGKKMGLTIEQCIELMEGRVAHYRVAGRSIYNHGCYRRGRTQDSRPVDGGHRGHWDVYILNTHGDVDCVCYDTTAHRAQQVIRAYINGTIQNVDSNILNNYVTNGYNTRAGLFRTSLTRIDKIKKIARSHADYLGNEVSSSIDHRRRVEMRNN